MGGEKCLKQNAHCIEFQAKLNYDHDNTLEKRRVLPYGSIIMDTILFALE